MFKKSILKKLIFWIILAIFILVFYFGYRFFAGYIPITNLKSVTLSENEKVKIYQEFKNNISPEYPLGGPFPLNSPNQNYYVRVKKDPYRRSEKLQVFSSDGKNLGHYSYRNFIVWGWEKDSSAIYIQQYEEGQGSIAILFEKPSKYGPMKKIFVPEEK